MHFIRCFYRFLNAFAIFFFRIFSFIFFHPFFFSHICSLIFFLSLLNLTVEMWTEIWKDAFLSNVPWFQWKRMFLNQSNCKFGLFDTNFQDDEIHSRNFTGSIWQSPFRAISQFQRAKMVDESQKSTQNTQKWTSYLIIPSAKDKPVQEIPVGHQLKINFQMKAKEVL